MNLNQLELLCKIIVCLFCIAGRQVGPDHICREKLEKTIILFTKVVSLIVIMIKILGWLHLLSLVILCHLLCSNSF